MMPFAYKLDSPYTFQTKNFQWSNNAIIVTHYHDKLLANVLHLNKGHFGYQGMSHATKFLLRHFEVHIFQQKQHFLSIFHTLCFCALTLNPRFAN